MASKPSEAGIIKGIVHLEHPCLLSSRKISYLINLSEKITETHTHTYTEYIYFSFEGYLK